MAVARSSGAAVVTTVVSASTTALSLAIPASVPSAPAARVLGTRAPAPSASTGAIGGPPRLLGPAPALVAVATPPGITLTAAVAPAATFVARPLISAVVPTTTTSAAPSAAIAALIGATRPPRPAGVKDREAVRGQRRPVGADGRRVAVARHGRDETSPAEKSSKAAKAAHLPAEMATVDRP